MPVSCDDAGYRPGSGRRRRLAPFARLTPRCPPSCRRKSQIRRTNRPPAGPKGHWPPVASTPPEGPVFIFSPMSAEGLSCRSAQPLLSLRAFGHKGIGRETHLAFMALNAEALLGPRPDHSFQMREGPPCVAQSRRSGALQEPQRLSPTPDVELLEDGADVPPDGHFGDQQPRGGLACRQPFP